MKRLILILTIFMILVIPAGSESGNLQYGGCPYSIFYDNETDKILLGNVGSDPAYVKVIDPETLVVEKSIPIYGNPEGIISICNGSQILALLSNTDLVEETEDGILQKFDYSTGNIIQQLPLNLSPMAMIADSSETYAYVTAGIGGLSTLYKINIDNLQIVDFEEKCGSMCWDIALSPDESKIYLIDHKAYKTGIEDPILRYQPCIGVFRISDLELIKRIFTVPVLDLLDTDNNGRLFASNATAGEGIDGSRLYESLYVIDTNTDEIIRTFLFDDYGIYKIDVDESGQYLYGTVVDVEEDSALGSLLELNLTDYSYRYIPVADVALLEIAIAPVNGGNRVFCISEDENDNYIYYKDIE